MYNRAAAFMMHIESGKCPGISVEKYMASRHVKAESAMAARLKSRETAALPIAQMGSMSLADGSSTTPDLLDQGPNDDEGGVSLNETPTTNTLAAAGLDSEEGTDSRQITAGNGDDGMGNDDLMSFTETAAPSVADWEDAGQWEPATIANKNTNDEDDNGTEVGEDHHEGGVSLHDDDNDGRSSSASTVHAPAAPTNNKKGIQQKITFGSGAAAPKNPGGWDPSRFYNVHLKKYVCACDKGFPTLQGFESHIKSGVHSAGVYR